MNLEKVTITFGIMALVVGFALGLTALIQVMNSNGRVDYCRVLYDNDSAKHPPAYRVIGHRNWHPDIDVAMALSAEEAAAKMQTLCPH